jgi:hypothetical protein
MGTYLRSNWIRTGLVLGAVGAGPLLFIIVAAALGWWPDPDPNPIGPGLLFMFLFWPALACILIGVSRVRAAQRNGTDRV